MKNKKFPNWDTHVQPHYPLTQIASDVWQVTGSSPNGKIPRNMVIYRMEGGGLWLHSVVALFEDTMLQLEALGEPEIMVIPNRMHRMDAKLYKERYPKIKILCPASIVQKMRKFLPIDDVADDRLPILGIGCHQPLGVRPYELCYEIGAVDEKVLVFSDLLFNLTSRGGFSGWLLKTLGSSGFFGMTRLGHIFLLKNKDNFADWLRSMAYTNGLKAICVGHGEAILHEPREHLEQAADRILGLRQEIPAT